MDNRDEILTKVYSLIGAYQQGLLGGEKIPEDENPHLTKGPKENYMYVVVEQRKV